MTFTILLTCVGGELSSQVIQLLKAGRHQQLRVVGVDARADAAGRHFADEFAVVPEGTDPTYTAAIADLVRRHRVQLVLPTSDEEALALVAARDDIERDGCLLACAPAEVLALVTDKAQTYRRLAEIGLPAPDWREARDGEQLRAGVAEIMATHGEAVMKPARGRGGRGVCVIRSDISGVHAHAGGRELHMDLATFEREYSSDLGVAGPNVVMRRLVEPVYDVDMLAWNGDPVRVVARRRVNSVLPNEGHTIVDNSDLAELGRRLITGLGLSWLYDCDVMYDADGQPGILEINPRPSGSVAATIVAGVPLLDDMISLAKGETPPDIEVPVGRTVVPYRALAVAGKT